MLSCGECGRPLCGQSAHGKGQVNRYYAHAFKRNDGTKCSVTRIRADDVEQVVINHLTEIVGRVGYFENLEKLLSESFNESPKQIQSEAHKLNKAVSETDEEFRRLLNCNCR